MTTRSRIRAYSQTSECTFHKSQIVTTSELAQDLSEAQHVEPPAILWTASNNGAVNLEKRDSWYGSREFIFCCLGFSLGLDNIWRYPSLVSRHGGTFIIPYTMSIIFCVLPMVYLELLMGQYWSVGPVDVWRLLPLFRGVGYSMLLICFLMVLYYSLLLPLPLFYFFSSMKSTLDFNKCNNTWNTDKCIEVDSLASYCSNSTDCHFVLPAKEYFENQVLHKSAGIQVLGDPNWILCLLLFVTYIFIFFGLIKGIQNRGKIMYVTVLAPWILLFILLIRNSMVDGAWDGMKYFLHIEWSALAHANIWLEGAGHAFVTLGPCLGVYMTLASYNRYHYNVRRDAILLVVSNLITSNIGGLVVFAAIGNLAYRTKLDFESVTEQGLGVIFVTYCEGLSKLNPQGLWSCLTFILIYSLSYNGQLAMVHCLYSSAYDHLPTKYRTSTISRLLAGGTCIILYLLGIPMLCEGGIYLFDLFDYFTTRHSLMVVCILVFVAMAWVYGWERLKSDIYTIQGEEPSLIWMILWQWISPMLLIIIVISYWASPVNIEHVTFPVWALVLGILSAWISIFPIPMFMIMDVIGTRGDVQALKDLLKPKEIWGPETEMVRRHWLRMTTPNYIYAVYSDEEDEDDGEGNARTIRRHDELYSNDDESFTEDLDSGDKEPWSNDWTFFLSCVSYAIGINNFWRFPYLCYRFGGGSFLIPYFIALLFLGVPLYFLELSLGQYSGLGPLPVWEVIPLLRGIGFGMVIVLLYMIVYHNVILSWVVYYFFACMDAGLPWTKCDNAWNTANCTSVWTSKLSNATKSNNVHLASEEYFKYQVLGLNNPKELQWKLLLSGLLIWVILTTAIMKGIRSSGRLICITTALSFLLLLVLLLWIVHCDGAGDGIQRYLQPKWEYLLTIEIWVEAAYHVVMSLGLGYGTVIMLANHNRFYVQCKKITYYVCFIEAFFSIIAGFLVFGILGVLAHNLKIPFDSLITESRSVMFVTFSAVTAILPFPHLLISLLFLTIICLGLDTLLHLTHTATLSLRDWLWFVNQFDKLQVTLILQGALLVSCALALNNGGYYLIQLLEAYASSWSTLFICFVEVIGIAYVLGYEKYRRRLKLMLKASISKYWKIMWCFLTPAYLLFLLFSFWIALPKTQSQYNYPQPWWSHFIGAFLLTAPILAVFIVPLAFFLSSPGSLHERLEALLWLDSDWDPRMDATLEESTYPMDSIQYRSRQRRRLDDERRRTVDPFDL